MNQLLPIWCSNILSTETQRLYLLISHKKTNKKTANWLTRVDEIHNCCVACKLDEQVGAGCRCPGSSKWRGRLLAVVFQLESLAASFQKEMLNPNWTNLRMSCWGMILFVELKSIKSILMWIFCLEVEGDGDSTVGQVVIPICTGWDPVREDDKFDLMHG